jgi:hypothetical protein
VKKQERVEVELHVLLKSAFKENEVIASATLYLIKVPHVQIKYLNRRDGPEAQLERKIFYTSLLSHFGRSESVKLLQKTNNRKNILN